MYFNFKKTQRFITVVTKQHLRFTFPNLNSECQLASHRPIINEGDDPALVVVAQL